MGEVLPGQPIEGLDLMGPQKPRRWELRAEGRCHGRGHLKFEERPGCPNRRVDDGAPGDPGAVRLKPHRGPAPPRPPSAPPAPGNAGRVHWPRPWLQSDGRNPKDKSAATARRKGGALGCSAPAPGQPESTRGCRQAAAPGDPAGWKRTAAEHPQGAQSVTSQPGRSFYLDDGVHPIATMVFHDILMICGRLEIYDRLCQVGDALTSVSQYAS